MGSEIGMRNVVVGIRLDGHGKDLLHWAVTEAAAPGDSVIAIHICRNSGCFSSEIALLDTVLDDYKDLCDRKQVGLRGQVLIGNSVRKVLVREAQKYNASYVIVGMTNHCAIGRWNSIARYCIKRLPPTTELVLIFNGMVLFRECCKMLLEDNCSQSEFGDSEVSETSKWSSEPIQIERRSSLSRISLPVEEFTRQRPGWPLLQTTSLITQPVQEARKMPIVQWVMNLPHQSSFNVFESNSAAAGIADFLERENRNASIQNKLADILNEKSACFRVFSYDLLRIATRDFSSENFIGKGGGCNSVYKGTLADGKQIAVKILESSNVAWKDYSHEINIMSTLVHKRITPLLGVCTEDDKLVSVYELLSKGNLEENLHKNSCALLQWDQRFRIAVGIAEALNYLHNECSKPVIHRDVKSSNILLTEELEPQLCDFGLAIWGPMETSFMMDSDVFGTFGYLAPEYFMYGKVSDKIDVYAFGVVLLELLSGRRPIGDKDVKGQESLVMWAKPKLQNGNLVDILDPNLYGTVVEDQMQRMGFAATLCLSRAPQLRPKMDQVLAILNGDEYTKVVPEYDDVDEDEVHPDSSVESHRSLALLDLNDKNTSFSSLDQSSPLSVEEYLK